MPLNNVNAEALRTVTYAAGKYRNFLEREMREMQNDVDCGIGCEFAVDKAKENLSILETCIFMMEQHIERFDNE